MTDERWLDVRRRLRARGLRWTPQRGVLLDVLAGVNGHVTGAAGRTQPGDRPVDNAVDGLPDPRCPPGARPRHPQPWAGRPPGVPRQPGLEPRPPHLL